MNCQCYKKTCNKGSGIVAINVNKQIINTILLIESPYYGFVYKIRIASGYFHFHANVDPDIQLLTQKLVLDTHVKTNMYIYKLCGLGTQCFSPVTHISDGSLQRR